jgi:uncharacterized repeat protein (TIGR01451 family)
MRKFLIVIGVCLLTPLAALNALAAIVSTSGAVVEIAPPPSVEFDVFTDDFEIRAFNEQQGIVLSEDLPVDISSEGTYQQEEELTPGTIPAGTKVYSHFIHFEQTGASESVTLAGSVKFDTAILGVITAYSNLDNTDRLFGAPGTRYPTGFDEDRALEIFPFPEFQDAITIGCNTVDVSFTAHEATDQMRVITGEQRCADVTIDKTPETPIVKSGGTAVFHITATNTGRLDLTNVIVTDDLAPDCARTIGNLAAGASTAYTCSLGNVTENFTNEACVSGTAGGDTAGDCAHADVEVQFRETACSILGDDRSPSHLDQDAYRFHGKKGEVITVTLKSFNYPGVRNTGSHVTLALIDRIRKTFLFKADRSDLPNVVKAVLPATGDYLVIVAEQPRWAKGKRYRGAYCVTLDSNKPVPPSLVKTRWTETLFE